MLLKKVTGLRIFLCRYSSTKSVCVIGAGPSGLCALRHLKDKFSKVVAFEQGDQLGGLWVYTDKTGQDDDGVLVHSSMYKNLRLAYMITPSVP